MPALLTGSKEWGLASMAMCEPLTTDGIRLLECTSGSKPPSFLITSIHDTPLFDPLSYFCGETTQQHGFKVGNTELQFNANVYNFISEYGARGSTGRLWVDAVCIDQTTRAEKGQQIPLMSDIYSAAQETIVWFGRPSGSVKVALDGLHEIVAFIEQGSLLKPMPPVDLRKQVA